MTWHQVRSRRYFYVSERVNGKPRRKYIGSGKVGEVAALTADLRRLEQVIRARELKTEKDRHQRSGTPLKELCDITEMLTRASLIIAGFHKHGGEWRCRRGQNPK